ncbi:hypothetical protein N7530_007356 [Penicillium desertorum]|uniref:Uncharacterized protein n=1 Tax=Penicillium desertorum TaxID=1303715 RepID=A0A9W9WM03_9EURO|nr:hypothetical protein N7530_007356 [Penicillium desertorum]
MSSAERFIDFGVLTAVRQLHILGTASNNTIFYSFYLPSASLPAAIQPTDTPNDNSLDTASTVSGGLDTITTIPVLFANSH